LVKYHRLIQIERGVAVPTFLEGDGYLLTLPEEQALIKAAIRFPDVVEAAARMLEPHRLTFYLNDTAGLFHSYYNKCKVLTDEESVTKARLYLVAALKIIFQNGLTLLGVSAPERM